MRITFSVDGGFAVFPGLSRPVSFEVDDLPHADAAALHAVVARSRFFTIDDASALPTSGSAGGADLRKYTVTIEDGIQRRSLVIPETVEAPDLKELLRLLDTRRRAVRSA